MVTTPSSPTEVVPETAEFVNIDVLTSTSAVLVSVDTVTRVPRGTVLEPLVDTVVFPEVYYLFTNRDTRLPKG